MKPTSGFKKIPSLRKILKKINKNIRIEVFLYIEIRNVFSGVILIFSNVFLRDFLRMFYSFEIVIFSFG